MPMSPQQIETVRELVTDARVLSLALVVDDAPVIGLLPFAVASDWRSLVVHASRLARHTRGLQEAAPFDALVHEPDVEGVDPLQVRRVTLRGTVRVLAEGDPAHDEAKRAYLEKFPSAAPITALGDFGFFGLEIVGGRLVTGFGAAANVTRETLEALSEGR
jgi:hypothetical protein